MSDFSSKKVKGKSLDSNANEVLLLCEVAPPSSLHRTLDKRKLIARAGKDFRNDGLYRPHLTVE